VTSTRLSDCRQTGSEVGEMSEILRK
jgi:hypothetical protein